MYTNTIVLMSAGQDYHCPMKRLGERLTTARKSKGLSQAQLARILGISRGACGQWEQGHSLPSVANIIETARLLNVSVEWLATGRGAMEYQDGLREAPADYGKTLSNEELELVSQFRQLSTEQRKALLKLMRTIA